GVLDVVQQADFLGGGGGANLPALAGELVVGVVADGPQDHGQDLVPGDVLQGTEGVRGEALDDLTVGAVVDIASAPVGGGDILELVPVLVQISLGVLHIAGDSPINQGSHL